MVLSAAVLVAAPNGASATPPVWQASSAIAASNGNDVTVTLPAHLANDVMLLQVVVRDTNDTITWPAGWAQIATVDRGATARYWWAWKRAASAAEPNPLVDKSTNSGDTYAAVSTYRGAVTTGDPWEVKGTPNAATTAAHVLNGITTLSPESLVVASLCGEDDAAASGTTFVATNPTPLAQVMYVESNTSSDGACTAGAAVRTTVGATGNVTATWTAAVVGSGGIVLSLKAKPPAVSSITRVGSASVNAGDTVSWTVVFSESVSGVEESDFALAQAGGVTGAGSLTVTPVSGTTYTVSANTGTGAGTLGLNLADNDSIANAVGTVLGGPVPGDGNFTGEIFNVFACTPPSGAPAGVTCVCDRFDRVALNPSTIYASNWSVSTSGPTAFVPTIVNNRLRLTSNSVEVSTAATLPAIFPAAGNYMSVDFKHFAYNGSGADGIAVTLSDHAVTPVPGGYGGSLGYAQRCGTNGFAGGWLGVAIDEYGNFRNDQECRGNADNNPTGLVPDSVSVRGSGTGMAGYFLHRESGGLTPGVDQAGAAPGPGHTYRVIVDHANGTNAWTTVQRDTGAGFSDVIATYDAKAMPGQAAVPTNWQLSLSGSTGGSTNIHDIDDFKVCATTIFPPSGGTASGFSAIDEAYGNAGGAAKPAIQSYLTGKIYMKLVGQPFQLNVAAISSSQVLTTYAAAGNRFVQVKLADNTDGVCILDSAQANYCNASCVGKAAVTGGSQVLTYAAANAGQRRTANMTLNSAHRNLAAIMRECTDATCSAFTATPAACSTDAFSVRPATVSSVASVETPAGAGNAATNGATTGDPKFKAASDLFALTATIPGIAGNANGYSGTLKFNSQALAVVAPATVKGSIAGSFPAATSGTPNAAATGTSFTYSEVGAFRLLGFDPATDTTSHRGVFDGVMSATECASLTAAQCDLLRTPTWSGVDGVSTKADCIADSFRNTRDTSGSFATNSNYGKFGCNFGLSSDTAAIGRFIPDHFGLTATLVTRSDIQAVETLATPFTYLGEPMKLNLVVTAYNAGDNVTANYAGTLTKLDAATLGTGANWFNTGCAAGTQCFGLGAVDGASGLSGRLAIDTSVANPASAWAAGVGSFAVHLTLSRPASATADATWGPYETLKLGAAPLDSDGVTLPAAASADNAHKLDLDATAGDTLASNPDGVIERRLVATTKARFGRLKLTSAFGSEKLPLTVPIRVEYWGGTYWTANALDDMTQLLTAASGTGAAAYSPVAHAGNDATNACYGVCASNSAADTTGLSTNYGGTLLISNITSASATAPIVATSSVPTYPAKMPDSTTVVDGVLGLSLSAPATLTGSFDLTLVAPPWLKYPWTGAGMSDPTAKVSFGLYRGSNRFIYRREVR